MSSVLQYSMSVLFTYPTNEFHPFVYEKINNILEQLFYFSFQNKLNYIVTHILLRTYVNCTFYIYSSFYKFQQII